MKIVGVIQNYVSFGWEKDEIEKILKPVLVPPNINSAREEVLKLIACGCKFDTPCARGQCSCRSSTLACSTFCFCMQRNQCKNPVKPVEDEQNSTGEEQYE